MSNKAVYEITLGNVYTSHNVIASSFKEAYAKALKLVAKELREDATLKPSSPQMQITGIQRGGRISL